MCLNAKLKKENKYDRQKKIGINIEWIKTYLKKNEVDNSNKLQ
jgi:hypothetical protein